MINILTKNSFLVQILKGFSQIMLQENRWTGLLIIGGLFLNHWLCGLAGIIATIAGTLTARILNFGMEEIRSGLYGFSPALTGVVIIFMFDATMITWIFVVFGGILSAVIQHIFISRKIPAYTFPFVIVSWGLVFLIWNYIQIPPSSFEGIKLNTQKYLIFSAIFKGFGQVIFQDNQVSGILFFIGVLICNQKAAIYGLAASLAGSILSFINHQPLEQLFSGIFGFNAVLTAIALVGRKNTGEEWIALGVLITIVINNLCIDYGIFESVGGVLTFPFVAGTWITILLQRIISKSHEM